MLAYAINTGRGQGDGLLAEVASALALRGVSLAGVIQSNLEFDPLRRCHMDLTILGQGPVVRISQDRGRHARGCRLDTAALSVAVAHVETALAQGQPRLLIINKFGKAEIDGGGFRDAIARAMLDGIPVLTTLSQGHLAAFTAFAADLATELPADPAAILHWCLDQLALPA